MEGHYKFQFSHFCWIHMALLLIVIQSHFIINNLFEGLIWFVLPVSLVITNDSMAYFVGIFFGRTPLIRLSPKKTWFVFIDIREGFIGAFFFTMIFAFFLAGALNFPYMTNSLRCQMSGTKCLTNPVFFLKEYPIHPILYAFLKLIRRVILVVYPLKEIKRTIFLYPIQLHSLVLAAFASLIAPFGTRKFNFRWFLCKWR